MRVAGGDERQGIRLLATHGMFSPLAAPPQVWARLGFWAARLGSVPHAAAAVAAIDRDGYLMTSEPKLYGDELPVIPI